MDHRAWVVRMAGLEAAGLNKERLLRICRSRTSHTLSRAACASGPRGKPTSYAAAVLMDSQCRPALVAGSCVFFGGLPIDGIDCKSLVSPRGHWLSGGEGSLARTLLCPKFPAKREKYREFRILLVISTRPCPSETHIQSHSPAISPSVTSNWNKEFSFL